MRGLEWKTILAAAIAASGILFAAGAQAHDDDRWRDDHRRWEHRHHHDSHEHRRHHDSPRRVVVEREPVFIERRPVVMAPAPVYMAPMAPAYSQPVDPSLNFNFTIPMR